jgi:preprotein translocase subunit SecG
MFVFLLVLHLIVAIALVTIILMQRSEGGGLTGASPSGLVSARGAADLMTRLTTIFAALFVILSIALAAYAAIERGPRKIDASLAKPATSSAPSVPVAGGNAANPAGTLDLNSLTPATAPAPTPVPIGGGTQNNVNTAPPASDQKSEKPAEQEKAATKQTPPPTAAVKEKPKPAPQPQSAPAKASEKAPAPPSEAPNATTNVPPGLIPNTAAPK